MSHFPSTHTYPFPCHGPQTLIDLAAASREMTEGVVGGHKDYSSWCEAAASISRSLMRQPQEFLDLATEELRKVGLGAGVGAGLWAGMGSGSGVRAWGQHG